ncbi:MAG: hypothetical protein CMO55_24475 [Verrucomicrobiales bacterium]|nr:hypothetical protein [Verrucomicrobiales bacterium]
MPDIRSYLQQTFERAGGAISFEDFMALALYDPEIGYYSAQIKEVGGSRGDFATSATLTNALGKAIAEWITEEASLYQWDRKIEVIEIGAGNGALAETILKETGFWRRKKIRYHIVDVSGPLRTLQQKRLKRFGVTWHENISAALKQTKGTAILFSNELVDAFPAKWLCWNEAMWNEVWVAFDSNTGLREEFRSFESQPEVYSALNIGEPTKGQRIEIQLSYREWLNELDSNWKNGSMLTIDYGGAPEEIYHRRPGGSVRGYYRQDRVEGGAVYQRIGKQDLTVDVNFTDLQNWGEELKWATIGQGTQQQFLAQAGQGMDEMAGHGVGEAFRFLHQRKAAKAD